MRIEFNAAMNHILKDNPFDFCTYEEINVKNINKKFILNSMKWDIRIDKFFLWGSYNINYYLMFSYIIASQCITNSILCTSIMSPIVLIQYDNWDEDVPEWFFVKVLSENDYKIYLWRWWIKWTKTPYIKFSL